MSDSDGTGDDGNFLRRWSRRKHETARAPQAPAVAEPVDLSEAAIKEPQSNDVAAPAAEPGGEPRRPLPDTSTLDGLRSEYGDFLKPDVDEGVRRAALKKLFADPHFAGMDPIEFYSQDFTHPDPIPAAMLATLNQARGLLFPHEDEKPAGVQDATPAGDAAPAAADDEPSDAALALPAVAEARAEASVSPEPAPGAGDAGKSGASG